MAATVEILAAVGLLIGCLAAWARLLSRREPAMPLIAYEPRRPVPWDLPIIAPVVLLFMGVRFAFMYLAQRQIAADPALQERLQSLNAALWWGEPDYARPMFQAAAAGQLVTGIAIAVLLMAQYRAGRDDLGLSLRRPGYDLRLGLIGFFALAVPALLLQGLLQWQLSESQHPIVLAFKNSTDGSAFFWAAVAAVGVAPVVEEFLFRGVLQGMFERIWTERTDLPPDDHDSQPVGVTQRPSFAPVFISAGIFALMHLASGIDVVPLFFLALGLGFLYRQTHRLWPGIVVHTLLNAFSMGMLLVRSKFGA